MPVPAIHVQSLEKDHRSAGEHLEGSTKELQPLQPVSQLHWGPNLNASMQKHAAWGINERSQRCVHTCRARITDMPV